MALVSLASARKASTFTSRTLFHLLPSSSSSLLSSRKLSLSSVSSERKLLLDRVLEVPSFGGSLWVTTGLAGVTRVLPVDARNLDRARIRVLAPDDAEVAALADVADVDVKQEGHKLNVVAKKSSGAKDLRLEQEIALPMVHNVSVTCEGEASVEASDLIESDYCHLRADSGSVTANRIRTGKLTLATSSGDITCTGHVQGQISITSESGDVIGEKRFTGPSLEVTTESGGIRVASCYTDQAKFATNTGTLNLRNVHNESFVAVYEQGDVNMLAVDGATNVFVKKGDVDCHVSQLRAESRIHVESGDVHLRIADTNPIKINIEANDIIPDAKFKFLGKLDNVNREDESGNPVQMRRFTCAVQPEKFSPTFTIVAENGNVQLESQDWASSLGIKAVAKGADEFKDKL